MPPITSYTPQSVWSLSELATISLSPTTVPDMQRSLTARRPTMTVSPMGIVSTPFVSPGLNASEGASSESPPAPFAATVVQLAIAIYVPLGFFVLMYFVYRQSFASAEDTDDGSSMELGDAVRESGTEGHPTLWRELSISSSTTVSTNDHYTSPFEPNRRKDAGPRSSPERPRSQEVSRPPTCHNGVPKIPPPAVAMPRQVTFSKPVDVRGRGTLLSALDPVKQFPQAPEVLSLCGQG
ncbi:uncharacterized protein TRAVEDRAFT_50765 [Trametes versicolor FP-101664 SS1]|uniref:uncharacterized protein n=1 Tax=Trametes versicolor (strain FP-101664) TaxID=717944 RepID=UPI00046213F3|nr:uncharacterized protein TRAVEDRAFT_50765 [Trametes versicolor FP-101664 SS1]EIW54628.1 hypothetical protein TRAVEDRAFT_50765 [Trametes versicolor FP-101664 SS1]